LTEQRVFVETHSKEKIVARVRFQTQTLNCIHSFVFAVAAEALIERATQNILGSASITGINVNFVLAWIYIHVSHFFRCRLLLAPYLRLFSSYKLYL
jgi:hypothetical protein